MPQNLYGLLASKICKHLCLQVALIDHVLLHGVSDIAKSTRLVVSSAHV